MVLRRSGVRDIFMVEAERIKSSNSCSIAAFYLQGLERAEKASLTHSLQSYPRPGVRMGVVFLVR